MRTLRVHLPAFVGAVCVSLVLSLAQQATAGCAPRPQDSLWLVDTRGAGCPADGGEPNLKYSHYENGHWVRVSREDFLANDDPSVPTTFLLHGNQLDVDGAIDMGLTLYSKMVGGSPDGPPIRWVIFTWPSERIDGGIVNDVRVKAARSDTAGYQLAWLLDQMNPHVHVTLIGYSFGARAISGALEMLGGGRIKSFELAQRVHPDRTPMSVVLMAAALDDDWLWPGHRDGHAMGQMDRLLLVNNSCDRVLKRYRFLYCGGCAAALGYVGLNTSQLSAADAAKVRQYDACCEVGKPHDWMNYACSPTIMGLIRPYVLPAAIPLAMAAN